MLTLGNQSVYLKVDNYEIDNTLAILILDSDGDIYGVLTKNIGESLGDDCAFVDTNNLGEYIVHWIIENNLGQITGYFGTSGFCYYPEIRFNMDEIKKHLA